LMFVRARQRRALEPQAAPPTHAAVENSDRCRTSDETGAGACRNPIWRLHRMHRLRVLSLTAAVVLAGSGMATAQEAGKLGITMSLPATAGVIWHVTEKVAVRPVFSFSQSSTESLVGADAWNFGTAINVLIYLRTDDNVRMYVTPGFAYSRNSSTTQSSLVGVNGTLTGWTSGGGAAFGAQYSPGPRFTVFGEAGLAFTRRSTDAFSSAGTTVKSTSWGNAASVGVIFYP
jgi:hypothetical protein